MQKASVPEAAVQVQGARQGQLLSEVRGQQGGGEKESEVVWGGSLKFSTIYLIVSGTKS